MEHYVLGNNGWLNLSCCFFLKKSKTIILEQNQKLKHRYHLLEGDNSEICLVCGKKATMMVPQISLFWTV